MIKLFYFFSLVPVFPRVRLSIAHLIFSHLSQIITSTRQATFPLMTTYLIPHNLILLLPDFCRQNAITSGNLQIITRSALKLSCTVKRIPKILPLKILILSLARILLIGSLWWNVEINTQNFVCVILFAKYSQNHLSNKL